MNTVFNASYRPCIRLSLRRPKQRHREAGTESDDKGIQMFMNTMTSTYPYTVFPGVLQILVEARSALFGFLFLPHLDLEAHSPLFVMNTYTFRTNLKGEQPFVLPPLVTDESKSTCKAAVSCTELYCCRSRNDLGKRTSFTKQCCFFIASLGISCCASYFSMAASEVSSCRWASLVVVGFLPGTESCHVLQAESAKLVEKA